MSEQVPNPADETCDEISDEIWRLTTRWDAVAARLAAAGLVEPDDLVTQEIWSHGATVVVDDGLDCRAYAIDPSGRLFRFAPEGWELIDEECCA
jgi:hypothetical protein